MAEVHAVDATAERRAIRVAARVVVAAEREYTAVVVHAGNPLVLRPIRRGGRSGSYKRVTWEEAKVLVRVVGADPIQAGNRSAGSPSGERRSGRLRGEQPVRPLDRAGIELAVGDAVAVTQELRGELRQCAGVITSVQGGFDCPKLTVGYAGSKAVFDFSEAAACVLRVEGLAAVCGCGLCVANDGSDGLCGASENADGESVASYQAGDVDTSDSERDAYGDCSGSVGRSPAARRRRRRVHRRNERRRRRNRDAAMAALAHVCNCPARLHDRPFSARVAGRADGRRADLSCDDLLMMDVFSGTKSMAMSAQAMFRTWGVSVDQNADFSPDVLTEFTRWNYCRFWLEHLRFVDREMQQMVWLPLHIHFSPSCTTFSCGSAWLSGRSQDAPYADAYATGIAFNADQCIHDMVFLIMLLRRYGAVTTFTIENPASSLVWRLLDSIMGADLGGVLDSESVDYCMYSSGNRKPTTIGHSPCLGNGWARRCNRSGACGGMRHVDGALVHGSPGAFGIHTATMPRELCDGLNQAWRSHHSALRAANPGHGAMTLEAVEAMQSEWLQRPQYVPPEPASWGSDSEAGEVEPESSAESDAGSVVVEDVPLMHICENCAAPHAVPGGELTPVGPFDPLCQICQQQEAGSCMQVAGEAGAVDACPRCFAEHFAWRKGE